MDYISHNTRKLPRFTLLLGFIAAGSSLLIAQATPPAETFADRAAKNHYSLEIKDGRFSGGGATMLESALADANFVLLGEDHGIAQIPQFDAAVCGIVGPKGFHDLAVEVGPSAAEQLSKWLSAKDGRSQLAAFEKEFPETVAFYNWSEEFDFLARCAQSSSGGAFELWGLDQELMGASRWLLNQILQQHLSPAAAAEGRHLLEENDAAHAQAAKSGNPFDLFMLSASDAELTHFRETLAHEGNPALPKNARRPRRKPGDLQEIPGRLGSRIQPPARVADETKLHSKLPVRPGRRAEGPLEIRRRAHV